MYSIPKSVGLHSSLMPAAASLSSSSSSLSSPAHYLPEKNSSSNVERTKRLILNDDVSPERSIVVVASPSSSSSSLVVSSPLTNHKSTQNSSLSLSLPSSPSSNESLLASLSSLLMERNNHSDSSLGQFGNDSFNGIHEPLEVLVSSVKSVLRTNELEDSYTSSNMEQSVTNWDGEESDIDDSEEGFNTSVSNLLHSVTALLHSNETFTLNEGTSLEQEMYQLRKMRRNFHKASKLSKDRNNATVITPILDRGTNQQPWIESTNDTKNPTNQDEEDPLPFRPRITPQDIEQQKERLRRVLQDAIDSKVDPYPMGRKNGILLNSTHQQLASAADQDQNGDNSSLRGISNVNTDNAFTTRRRRSLTMVNETISDQPCRKPQRSPSSVDDLHLEYSCADFYFEDDDNEKYHSPVRLMKPSLQRTWSLPSPKVSPTVPSQNDSSSTLSTHWNDFSYSMYSPTTPSRSISSSDIAFVASGVRSKRTSWSPNVSKIDKAIRKPTRRGSLEHNNGIVSVSNDSDPDTLIMAHIPFASLGSSASKS
jgi:hypothetical protein